MKIYNAEYIIRSLVAFEDSLERQLKNVVLRYGTRVTKDMGFSYSLGV